VQRNGFFLSNQGFSLTGTLIAVAIGAIVASLVASVITEAVKGQRSLIDRDEMSEFSLYIKNLLANDATCLKVLRGVDFPLATGSETNLSFNEGYQDRTGPIQEGFTFSGKDTLRVVRLRMRDKGIPPLTMNAAVTDAAGVTTVQSVRRVMAQIILQLDHKTPGQLNAAGQIGSSGYRPRYFEIPVHIDATNKVVSCVNEFNISDACDAMGFRYNPNATTPDTLCQPDRACFSGGSYGPTVNPATGGYSCPDGFTAYKAGAYNIRARSCGKYCCFPTYQTMFHCLRCP